MWHTAMRRASFWRQGGNRSMLRTELVAGGGNSGDVHAAASHILLIPLSITYSFISSVQISAHKSLLAGEAGPLCGHPAEVLCAGGREATEPGPAQGAHAATQALLHLIRNVTPDTRRRCLSLDNSPAPRTQEL